MATECQVYESYRNEDGVIVYEKSKASIDHSVARVDRPCIGDQCLEAGGLEWYRVFIYLDVPQMIHWGAGAMVLVLGEGDYVLADPPSDIGGIGNLSGDWIVVSPSDLQGRAGLTEMIPVTQESNYTFVVFVGKKSGEARLKAGLGYPYDKKVRIVCYHDILI